MGNNKMNTIKELISQQDWSSLISNYSVKNVCSSLNFTEAMHAVKHLFFDDFQDYEKQQYALKLVFEIKDHFKGEWESDWKNDVFLGDLCEILWLYDKRYLCYKRAYDKLKDPPAELLLLLSDCNSAPGTPPITDEESEFYLMKAAEKRLTCEVAFSMRSFYRLIKEDKFQEEYWDQIYKKLEKENIHSDQLIPDVLKS
jgi:hypothetical protein